MRFLFVGSHVCRRLPPDGRSPFRPCLGLVLVLLWFSYRGLTPQKFTPVPGVHKRVETDAQKNARLTRVLDGEVNMKLNKINYEDLNPRAKEMYNLNPAP